MLIPGGGTAARLYVHVRNPYVHVPIRSIKSDFFLNFNFSGDFGYDSGLQ